jgi:hypothetical protein
VIDFGEMCVGNPATALAAAWLLLPTERQMQNPAHFTTKYFER